MARRLPSLLLLVAGFAALACCAAGQNAGVMPVAVTTSAPITTTSTPVDVSDRGRKFCEKAKFTKAYFGPFEDGNSQAALAAVKAILVRGACASFIVCVGLGTGWGSGQVWPMWWGGVGCHGRVRPFFCLGRAHGARARMQVGGKGWGAADRGGRGGSTHVCGEGAGPTHTSSLIAAPLVSLPACRSAPARPGSRGRRLSRSRSISTYVRQHLCCGRVSDMALLHNNTDLPAPLPAMLSQAIRRLSASLQTCVCFSKSELLDSHAV